MNLFENIFNRLLIEDMAAGDGGVFGGGDSFGHGGAVPGGSDFYAAGAHNIFGAYTPTKKPCKKRSKKKKRGKKMLKASKQLPIQTRYGLAGSDKPPYGSM